MNRLPYLLPSALRLPLPRISIAERVIAAMVRGALHYDTETGEALIGLSAALPAGSNAEPQIAVLDTVAPDASAVRHSVYFEQGDEWQSEMLRWLSDNWDDTRQRPDSTPAILPLWNVPLIHLGDWHKHPGTLTEPSRGDTHTAREVLADRQVNAAFLLAILATVWDRDKAQAAVATLSGQARPLLIDPPEQPASSIRLDCWYMSARNRRFVHVAPTVQPDSALPTLPIRSWHLAGPGRMRWEIVQIEKAGYAVVSVDQHDVDQVPPRELCLTLERDDGQRVWIAVTQADYPRQRPELRQVPAAAIRNLSENADLFLTLWPQSRPLSESAYPTWDWTASHSLGDLLAALDASPDAIAPEPSA